MFRGQKVLMYVESRGQGGFAFFHGGTQVRFGAHVRCAAQGTQNFILQSAYHNQACLIPNFLDLAWRHG